MYRGRLWTMRRYSGMGGNMLTRKEPLNNIVRTAYEAPATILGGARAVDVAAFDEAYAIPTEESQRVALRPNRSWPMKRAWPTSSIH
jgi:methylmalonyl-CoA mutase, N-terminal domain